jgi:hypothetical protein
MDDEPLVGRLQIVVKPQNAVVAVEGRNARPRVDELFRNRKRRALCRSSAL